MKLLSMFVRLGSANAVMLGVHVFTIAALGAFAPAEQFALFLLALSISQPFATFAGLRLESAFPSIGPRRELETMLVLASISVVAVSALQFVIVNLIRSYGLFELDKLDLGSLVLLPFITFAQALVQIGRLWAVRFARIDHVAKSTYVRAATTTIARGAVIALVLTATSEVWIGRTALLLIAGELLTTVVMAIALFPREALQARIGRFRIADARAALRRNWKFPALETPSTILDNLAMNTPIFLVTQFYGLSATASFGLAFRGLAVPVAQISRTLTEVMQVRYSEMQRAGQMQEFAYLFRRSTMFMAAGAASGIVLLLVLFGLAGELVPRGRAREFAIIVLLISPWVAGSAVVNINSRLLLMLKRQELKLLYDSFGIAMIGVLVGAERWLAPSFYGYVAMISSAQLLGYILYWALLRRAVNSATDAANRCRARGK